MTRTSQSQPHTTPSASSGSRGAGFDSAIKTRAEDHLNRWPFAQEIYGIATTGPAEWSVRVGIYGEWGTGKSSVLEFIGAMAERDEHTLIRFNPWQYSTKNVLWREFVSAVYNQPIFASMERAGWVRIKNKSRWVLDRTKVVEEGTKLFNEKAGKALSAGLDVTKSWFTFSAADLKALHKKLGDKRVIVLIDDLDRTAPELVPEILFALKELMNTPQFSFICAFDPVIVGEVLRRYHPGFGDGLKFLEKIIDYPRWLPPPTREGLASLALADSKIGSPYVPEQPLRDAVSLLPANPRAVRQFIRLLALLRPQIERHYPDELRWPSILAANVLKIRHPRIAYAILKNETFWEKIESISVLAKDQEEKDELNKAVETHVSEEARTNNVTLEQRERDEITAALRQLCTKANIWLGGGFKTLAYQMDLAEAPHAVTWKEFDEFFSGWAKNPTSHSAEAWFTKHGRAVNRLPIEVQRETFQATIQRYAEALQAAETVLTDSGKTAAIKKVEHLLALTECLIFDLGHIRQPEKNLNEEDLALLFQKFMSFTNSLSPVHMQFQNRNEALLFRLVKEWVPDVTPLVKVLKPYGHFPGGLFDNEQAHILHQNLCKSLLPGLAIQVIGRFREPGFAKDLHSRENEMYAVRGIILQANGPMWAELRQTTFALFDEAASNAVVQENAFDLLRFFDYKLRKEQGSFDALHVKDLLSDKEIAASLWAAVTATLLSPAATAHLNQMMPSFKAAGVSFILPAWWDDNLKMMAGATEAAKMKVGVEQEATQDTQSTPDTTSPNPNPDSR